jgi:hypothetical protein
LGTRSGWRAQVHKTDSLTLEWTNLMLAGKPLSQALDHVGGSFDFAQWLARAIRDDWLHEVRLADAA